MLKNLLPSYHSILLSSIVVILIAEFTQITNDKVRILAYDSAIFNRRLAPYIIAADKVNRYQANNVKLVIAINLNISYFMKQNSSQKFALKNSDTNKQSFIGQL